MLWDVDDVSTSGRIAELFEGRVGVLDAPCPVVHLGACVKALAVTAAAERELTEVHIRTLLYMASNLFVSLHSAGRRASPRQK